MTVVGNHVCKSRVIVVGKRTGVQIARRGKETRF
jgi:hypothetical protein